MKNILNIRIPFLLVFSITVIIAMFTSCNNDDNLDTAAPVITDVRIYAKSPGDSIVNKVLPGQWVVLSGKNLKNAVEILVDGVSVDFNPGLFSDTHAVIQIPSVIPFPSVPESLLNTITYVTTEGSVVFPFNIVPGPPSIYGISNENPVEGDVVTVFGTNLFLTSELVFAGTTITEFTEVDNGTSISFVIPNITTSGPLSITTASGSTSTFFNVNDLATGMLCNFDDIGSLAWGTGTSNSDPDFPGNHGYYPILNNGVLNGGEWSWWGWERSINIDGVQWVQTADLNLNIDQFALKFEINVPGDWNGGSIVIVKDYNWTYLARFEPWKISPTKTSNFTTDGKWTTITIPFTEFRTKKDGKDGTGDQPTSLTELVGASGSGGINFFTINDTSAPTATGLRAAIDNIRVIQIK